MINAINVERLDGRHAIAGDISEPDLILGMDDSYRTRRQDSEQFRHQEIHLPEKSPIGFVSPEIVITGAVFVMIAEWD